MKDEGLLTEEEFEERFKDLPRLDSPEGLRALDALSRDTLRDGAYRQGMAEARAWQREEAPRMGYKWLIVAAAIMVMAGVACGVIEFITAG